MTRIEAFGKVEDSGLKIVNRRLFDMALRAYQGKEVVIIIERKKKKRSVQQNRYYHGIVLTMLWQRLLHLGHQVSIEIVHEWMKSKFLTTEVVNKDTGELVMEPGTDKILTRVRSTTELTTSEMMDYIASIQQFAAEHLDLAIPDPLTADLQ